tara:strand:- start:28 stop:189 length:162 start_codon:yes stop_codon:yes gene_type:complete
MNLSPINIIIAVASDKIVSELQVSASKIEITKIIFEISESDLLEIRAYENTII